MAASQSITPPPWIADPQRWVTASEFARLWNRSPRTVQKWCKSGYLLDFGIKVYQDFTGSWWIQLPLDS